MKHKPKARELGAVERDAKGRVIKGALNPGGRPKEEREVVEALRLEGMALVKKLLFLALKKGNVKAIQICLERAYGKPRDRVELTGAEGGPLFDLSRLTDAQLDALEQLHEIARGDADAAEPH